MQYMVYKYNLSLLCGPCIGNFSMCTVLADVFYDAKSMKETMAFWIRLEKLRKEMIAA